MDQELIYLVLFGIIVILGQIFNRTTIPISLLLVISGMCMSFIPDIPDLRLNPDLVLNIFLPVLIYQISSSSSWKDLRKNRRPILLLSVGHVIFIACAVALVMHALIPQMSWPMAFLLGALVSPPDDVAIVSIAEKIRMPARIVTILEGEGMFNDATALIMFRFSLAAIATHTYSATGIVSGFFAVIIGETLYGLLLGFVIGELRKKISNTSLHMIASLITPFLAYYPATQMGGCGVLATAVTGFVIGNRYALYFTPEFRLISRAVWPMLSFLIQSILYLLLGLNLHVILKNISEITLPTLYFYSLIVILIVVIGRFVWVYPTVYLPRLLFKSILKKDPYPPWQYPIIVSWAGMRGSISLAAALAVPALPTIIDGVNTQDFLLFIVFSVIVATFVLQGLTLPFLLKILGVKKIGQQETYKNHMLELKTRLKLIRAVLRWLIEYKKMIKEDHQAAEQVEYSIDNYRRLKAQLRERIEQHDDESPHDEKVEAQAETFLASEIIRIERDELLRLWRNEKVNLHVRDKLLERLDHRTKFLPS
jgi:Na+/H+ antiporter